jgi:hypothetical protein
LDIVNSMINLPQAVLTAAENMYYSCSNLISIVEELTPYAANLQGHKVMEKDAVLNRLL